MTEPQNVDDELLRAVKPLIDDLNIDMPSPKVFWQTVVQPAWVPLVLEVAAFLVALVSRSRPNPWLLLVSQILILVALIWLMVLQLRRVDKSIRNVSNVSSTLTTRLQSEAEKLIGVCEAAKNVYQNSPLKVSVFAEWFDAESERWDAFQETLFGRVSVVTIASTLLAVAFTHAPTIHIFDVDVPSWSFYLMTLLSMFFWVIAAVNLSRASQLELIGAVIAIGIEEAQRDVDAQAGSQVSPLLPAS